jgi:hypothetical protein
MFVQLWVFKIRYNNSVNKILKWKHYLVIQEIWECVFEGSVRVFDGVDYQTFCGAHIFPKYDRLCSKHPVEVWISCSEIRN